MTRKISVIVPNLTEAHIQSIKTAAAKNNCEVRFFDTPDKDSTYIQESEIVFGHQPQIAKTSKNLQWMCTPFAGVDQLTKPDSFANENAVLTNSAGAYGVTISEHIFMLLLAILRRDPDYRKIVEQKKWIRDLPIRSIHGSRITLLGTGDIGTETAKRLKPFNPKKITGINRSGRKPDDAYDAIATTDNLNSILPETDILIISLPGTRETYHLLKKQQLSLLPDNAILINVGRGSVIDQKALTEELDSGRLYAGLDVFEEEPIQENDPLWTQKNLLITPHTAGNMTLPHTVTRIVEMFTEDLDNFCNNIPLIHTVIRDRGY